jgi:hypothetical protein
MTTREMLTVDLSSLIKPTNDKEAVQSSAGIQYFEIPEENHVAFYNMMDEEDIVIEEDLVEAEEEVAEGQEPVREENDVHNPHDQPLHPEEDEIRGKLAVDVPSYTPNERLLLGAITHLRKQLIEPDVTANRVERELYVVVRKLAKSCRLIDGKVMKLRVRGGIREVPESLLEIKDILKKAHDGSGHKGLDATMAIITARYWIPVLEKVVSRHIARCNQCQRFAKAHKLYSPNYSVTSYDIFKHWGIDTVGPFPEDAQGNKYAILAVEFLTRWPEAIPAKTATASEAAHFIYNHLICRYGIPQSIQSDNGPQFANEVIENLTNILQIRHQFSTPYYPQANGRAERLIGTLKNMLVKSIQDIDKEEGTVNWTPSLYSALYIYRSTKHSATGTSPAMLVYGEELQLPIMFDNTIPTNQIQHRDQITERLKAIRSYIPGLRTSQFRYAVTKEGKKILIRPTKYTVDEKVLLRNSKYDKAGHSASPFEYRYLGPYQIHKILTQGAYVLKTIPEGDGDKPKYFRKPVNWSRLRRFIENEEDLTEV